MIIVNKLLEAAQVPYEYAIKSISLRIHLNNPPIDIRGSPK